MGRSSTFWGDPIRVKVLFVFLLIVSGGAAYYFYVYRPAHSLPPEMAYVLPAAVAVVDSPAEVRLPVEVLKNGDAVRVLARIPNWARVRTPDGRSGWIEVKNLFDAETHEVGQRLLKQLETIPPQAVGHTYGEANLRIEPSRDASLLAQFAGGQKIEIFGRRLIERAQKVGETAESRSELPPRDAWYLVRAESRAGWLIGRFVVLDIPEEISTYAQNINLVAWLVLKRVQDGPRKVPQYLVADRIGEQNFDFNHIRVFTWWTSRHKYVTTYVESNFNGYFPIRVTHRGNDCYFVLRLVDQRGRKMQKVYGLVETAVHPLSVVRGWEIEALPAVAQGSFKPAR